MRQVIRQLLLTLLFIPTALSAQAQGFGIVRGNCTPDIGQNTRGLVERYLQQPNNNWNYNTVYKQMVILVSFSDKAFTCENPNEYYHKVLNEPGYNEGAGAGCMADYFRDQSNGMFNLQFDVYGPYQVSSKAQPYDNPTANNMNYGSSAFREATKKMMAENPDLDYRQYDWNNDGMVDQVLYVYAGPAGNQGESNYGYIWPNTSTFSAVTAPDGTNIRTYSCSSELWMDNTLAGTGTLCHEFSHALGLPDIYPTGGNSGYYSVADEWDLMDGGNFTNKSWCPPNYTALEKMLLGWLTPIELTEPATITGMKSVSEGGEVYLIKHTDNEFLLLENRQWKKWDAGIPGRGLVIYHVDYDEAIWVRNTVNNTKGHFRFDLVHADNLDYEDWNLMLPSSTSSWAEAPMMHNWHLSTSPYPWSTDSTAFVNNELTDNSIPATMMFNENSDGSKLLSKSITNIQMTDDGLISFDFMGGNPAGISTPHNQSSHENAEVYNMMGQRMTTPYKGLFIKNGKKYIKH